MKHLQVWLNDRRVLGLSVALLVYSLIGFSLVPALVQWLAPRLGQEYLQRPVTLRGVQFNPFRFTLKFRDFSLTEADGTPLLGLKRLRLNLDPLGFLTRRAVVISELELRGLAVNVVQTAEGRLNWSKLADGLPKSEESPPPPADEPPPRLVLERFRLVDGSGTFTDQGAAEPFTETVEGLQFELTNLSTLPESSGVHQFEAQFPGGGRLDWRGDLSLNPIASSGDFHLDGLTLAPHWDLLRERLDLAEPQGTVQTGFHYRFAYDQGKADFSLENLEFKLQGLRLATADRPHPLAELEEFSLAQGRFDLTGRTLELPSIVMRKGKFQAERDGEGRLDWLSLARPGPATSGGSPPPPAAAASPRPEAAPWTVKVGGFKLSEIGLQFSDASHKLPLLATVGDFGLALGAEATVGSGAPQAKADLLDLHLNQIALSAAARPLFALEELKLAQVAFDLAEQTLRIQDLSLRKGALKAAVDAAGQLDWLALTEPARPVADSPAPNGPPPAEPPPAVPGKPWKLALNHFGIAELSLDFADASKNAPFAAAVGDFGVDFRAEVEAGAGAPKGRVDGLGLHLNKLALTQGEGVVPLSLEEIGLDQASLDLAGQELHLPSVRVRKGLVSAAIDREGGVDWLAMLEPVATGPAGSKEPGAGRGAAVAGRAASPVAAEVPAPPRPAASAKQNSKPSAKAPGQPSPAHAPWKIGIDSFRLSEIGLRADDASRKAPLSVAIGDFGLEFKLGAEVGGGEPRGQVSQLGLHLDRLAVTQGQARPPIFGWEHFAVEGGEVDLARRQVSLRRVGLHGGHTAVTREAGGVLQPLAGFEPLRPPVESAVKSPPAKPSAGTETDWRLSLGEFDLDRFGVSINDRNYKPELAYDIDDLQVQVKNLSTDSRTPFKFESRLKVRQGGSLQLSGNASLKAGSAKAKLKLDKLDLKQLQPVLAEFVNLRLVGADVSTALDLDFEQAEPKPRVKVGGGIVMSGLRLLQTQDDKVFLAWKKLRVDGLRFSLAPDNLVVKEIHITEPEATVAIAADRSTNIQRLAKGTKAKAPEPKTGEPASVPPRAAAAPMPLAIERVRIDNGRVDFSDLSLVLPFATKIHDFSGVVTGVSLSPKAKTTLKFNGEVGQFGEVNVDGSLSPMAIKEFSDVRVVFRNVAMPELSPYSATFAGRRIQSGKLNLDLLYKIQDHQLQSENKIVLDDFTLGERVEAPKAIDLPLDLAIAILKGPDGRISADVPITGTVDDPKFGVGKLVWDAVVKLVTGAVTAPFRAIGSVFGAGEGAEKLDAVLFPPGQDVLPPPEKEKLKVVADGLVQRPQLQLTITGQYDPKADGSALKARKVREALAEQMGIELEPGEDLGPVAYSDVSTQKALEKLAKERISPDAIEAVQTAYLKETGKLPQRVGALAGLTGKASETPDFYEKIYQDLVEQTPLGPADLAGLAERRMKAVTTELVEGRRLERGRVSAGKPQAGEAKDGSIACRLELGVKS